VTDDKTEAADDMEAGDVRHSTTSVTLQHHHTNSSDCDDHSRLPRVKAPFDKTYTLMPTSGAL